jgi:predicted XRE-type DNA-binding protein
MTTSTKIHPSSGNVFADIGVAEPEEALAKSELAILIAREIEKRGLTQAGVLLGIEQPTVSELLRGHIKQFSKEQLLRFQELLLGTASSP